MKIALICDSLLLDRSLEMYLKEHLTSYKLCDFVVATQKVESQKPVFLIGDFEGANLKIPFTREILLQELEAFDGQVRGKAIQESQNEESRIPLGMQEQGRNEGFIKETNLASASFDTFEISKNQEIFAPKELLESSFVKDLPESAFSTNSLTNPANNFESSKCEDSALNAKIEAILRRFAKEIEAEVLAHYKDKNA